MAGVCLATNVGACGMLDSQVSWSFIPDSFKGKAPQPPPQDPLPDVKAIARDRRQELFSGTIDTVLVSAPKPQGSHWQFCARPVGRGASGQPLQVETYLVDIEQNVIGDRQRVDASHWCNRETFEHP